MPSIFYRLDWYSQYWINQNCGIYDQNTRLVLGTLRKFPKLWYPRGGKLGIEAKSPLLFKGV